MRPPARVRPAWGPAQPAMSPRAHSLPTGLRGVPCPCLSLPVLRACGGCLRRRGLHEQTSMQRAGKEGDAAQACKHQLT